MAVVTEYYSDKDPATRFTDKKQADAHDRLMEQCEDVWERIQAAAGAAGVSVSEEQAWDIARTLLADEEFKEVVTGKKPRPAKAPAAKAPERQEADEGSRGPARKTKAA